MAATMSRWELIGRGAALGVAVMAAYAVLAILEIEWPDATAWAYEAIVDGAIFWGLGWLFFRRLR